MFTANLTCFFFEVKWELDEEEKTASVVLCILCALFAITAISGNGIVLFIIWKTQELHSPSFILLFCLAMSDLLVGLVGQPSFVAYKIAESLESFSAYCNLRLIQFFCGWISSSVSFITVSGISVDRLLALHLHLRYKSIITVRRVITAIIIVWLVCSVATTLKLWVQNWIIIAIIGKLSAITTTAFCTGKIFRIARGHERQITGQNNIVTSCSIRTKDINVRACKKSATTVIYVFSWMLMFYLPFLVVMAMEMIKGDEKVVKIAYEWASLLVFINSSVNPVIYCWRMEQIRLRIKSLFKRKASSNKIHSVSWESPDKTRRSFVKINTLRLNYSLQRWCERIQVLK